MIDVAQNIGATGKDMYVLAVPTVLFFLYYLISRASISSRVYFEIRRQNVLGWNLDKIFAEKIESLSLSEVDNRDFANKVALAEEAKAAFMPRAHNAMAFIQNFIIILIVAIPLVLEGYWLVIIGMILLMYPVLWINSIYIKKNAYLKESEVENKRKQVQAIRIHTGITEATKEIKINAAYPILTQYGIEYQKHFNNTQMGYRTVWWKHRVFMSLIEAAVIGSFIVYYVYSEITGAGNVSGVIPFFGTILMLRVTFNNFVHSLVNISEYHDEIFRLRNFFKKMYLFLIQIVRRWF